MTALRCPHCGSLRISLNATTIETLSGQIVRRTNAYWCDDCGGVVLPPKRFL